MDMHESLENMPEYQPVFMFYSRSKDDYPGRGPNETIDLKYVSKYEELSKIPGWRRVLSNFFARNNPETALFYLDNLHWRSVEHYFQANKFIEKDPAYYHSFALESGHPMSRGDGVAAKRAGRHVKLTSAEVAEWESRKSTVMDRAQEAKFTQNADCAKVLQLTDGALLTHRATFRSPICYETSLMELRSRLPKKSG